MVAQPIQIVFPEVAAQWALLVPSQRMTALLNEAESAHLEWTERQARLGDQALRDASVLVAISVAAVVKGLTVPRKVQTARPATRMR
jgi:hypothetical protein